MDVILIPGFWLDASSWSEVTPALEQAGHAVHALTLPGLASRGDDRSGIGFDDHVDAVVARIDELPDPVVLVGHSGGGAVAGAAADRRVDRVAHAIYVDSGPLSGGASIDADTPVVDSEVPLPGWTEFGNDELADLTEKLREEFRARAVPVPAGVARDPIELTDERRHDIPTTVIACSMSSEIMGRLMEQGHPYLAELALQHRYRIVDLPTGHWPQLTRPVELGGILIDAIADPPA